MKIELGKTYKCRRGPWERRVVAMGVDWVEWVAVGRVNARQSRRGRSSREAFVNWCEKEQAS